MEICGFEIAKKLKEKGFKDICSHYYRTNSKDLFMVFPCEDWNDIKERINAPTISQVLKWLREEKDLFIQIMFIDKSSYYYEVIDIAADKVKCSVGDYKDSPELAALAGIEYIIDNNLI